MAEYECNKCGYVSNKPVIKKSAALKNRKPPTIEQTEKKFCPVCGAEQSELGKVEREDTIGRYD
jgi:rubredoxin